MLELEKSLLKMNCVITDILPNFNSYVGAQKIAGKSSLYRFETIPPFKVTIPQYFGGLVYTGEINPVVRFYECKECHTLLKPLAGNCCVFCSYGSVPCPPIQLSNERKENRCCRNIINKE